MRILKFHEVLQYANARRLQELCVKRWPRSICTTRASWAGKDDPSKEGMDQVLRKKYTDTLQLPKTTFPMKIPFPKRNAHELQVAENMQFDQLYGLQRLWRQEQPEFILHDGPPYANGDCHIGHAVNKVLKDVTNRYKLLRGYKVNYIAGWDCHGLPIELKALKQGKTSGVYVKDPLTVREKAKEIVNTSLNKQKESFRRWGVMAEWESVYQTRDNALVQAQLRAFYKLFKKGLVFRDLKPVYWSPSSETCLAEAELEYNASHKSPSVYLALELKSDLHEFASVVGKSNEGLPNFPVKAVIWTTTPWTLPSNKAIAYNENQEYTLLRYDHRTDNSYLVVASHLAEQVAASIGRKLVPVFSFSGSQLRNFQYRHPWFEDQYCPLLHGNHVAGDKGTGLVHTAPAHGQDDFVLGLQHKLEMDCYIDKDGNFDSRLERLKGLPALSGGNKAVLNHIKDKVLMESTITHSYPYDWRTKKPVLIKTSLQWFLDTEKLKNRALEQLEKVSIYPKNIENLMKTMVAARPYWCISRQRFWGVPIPVLYDKTTGEPHISEDVINEMCKLVETTGGLDFWWTVPISELVKDKNLAESLVKGQDIFDIWLDSGLTWQMLGSDKVADLYLEGQDQFQGWFQSSLLTSVGLRECAPYKNLYVHGFVVDEDGRKMSKSVGNVVDPSTIICGSKDGKQPAYGADVLRWWVTAQGSADGSNISVSNNLIRSADDGVQKLRNVFKFLISFCNEEMNLNDISYDELMYSDQYMLKILKDFQRQVTEYYDGMNYHRGLMKTLHFATTEVSSLYLTWVKDRLYCDLKTSESRKSCIYVLNQIYLTLAKVTAPILPFLVEESYSHYQIGQKSIFRSLWFDINDTSWDNSQIASMFELVLDIRTSLNHVIGANNPKDVWVEMICTPEVYKKLQLLHPVAESNIVDKCDSELCDILQVSGVDLKSFETPSEADGVLPAAKFSAEPLGVSHSLAGFSLAIRKTQMSQCARCRRYCCEEGNVLCQRCLSVIQRILRKQSKEEINAHRGEKLKEMAGKKN